MNRLQLETEVLHILGLMGADGATINASVMQRTYIQSRIEDALEHIFYENRWMFRRKRFGAPMKAPILTGLTANMVQGTNTITVNGATPDASWIGGHCMVNGDDHPMFIVAVNGQVITTAEYITLATQNTSFAMYFDGVTVPADMSAIKEKTMMLSGHGFLYFLPPEEMQMRQGYWGGIVGDYGQIAYINRRVVRLPDVGEPIYWTTWQVPVVNSAPMKVISVYPYPAQFYALAWDGFRKHTPLGIDGGSTGDAGIPDIPEQYHRSVLLPMVKLKMTEYPGFEISQGEKATLQAMVTSGMVRMYNDQRDTEDEVRPIKPARNMLGLSDY